MSFPILNSPAMYEAAIRRCVDSLPPWYVVPAAVSAVKVSPDPKVAEQVAMYRHGTRDILVRPNAGEILQRAMAHELAHGFDDQTDRGGSPHAFSVTPQWIALHRAQGSFEIPKYRDDPRECFADMAATWVLRPEKFRLINPRVCAFFDAVVKPVLVGQYQAASTMRSR